jgi:TolA-binding protein
MTERSGRPRTPKELERSLLASARLDVRPAPQAVRNRILGVMTAMGALGTGSAVAGATSGALGRLAIVKWIAATAIVGAASAGGYTAVKHARLTAANVGRASDPQAVVARGNASPVQTLENTRTGASPSSEEGATPTAAPVTAATPPPAPVQRHRAATPKAASPGKTAADTSSLEGEVAALDRARAALVAGDPARTIDLLDGYEQAFPKGALRQEATYLRIQAFSKSGQRGGARDLAARLLADHPESPHASQLRQLLSP